MGTAQQTEVLKISLESSATDHDQFAAQMIERLHRKSDPYSRMFLKYITKDCCLTCYRPREKKKRLPCLRNYEPLEGIPEICCVCYEPNYTPVQINPCGHNAQCVDCVVGYMEANRRIKKCFICRASCRGIMPITALPQYRISHFQTVSSCNLASPFSEERMGFFEIERKQVGEMDLLGLVKAWCVWAEVVKKIRWKFRMDRRRDWESTPRRERLKNGLRNCWNDAYWSMGSDAFWEELEEMEFAEWW